MLTSNNPMQRWCSIRASSRRTAMCWQTLATLRAAGVPALTDDNYAVMKVARIGCECGANVSTFSCFSYLGQRALVRW
ncbi:hypothetical protein DMI65_01205 [Escherichia coli]|nr:hypothetical protein [Escherichia coli]